MTAEANNQLIKVLYLHFYWSCVKAVKLCKQESRLSRQSGVLKLVINKIWYNGHPLLLDAINKQCPPPQYSMRLVKQRFK